MVASKREEEERIGLKEIGKLTKGKERMGNRKAKSGFPKHNIPYPAKKLMETKINLYLIFSSTL